MFHTQGYRTFQSHQEESIMKQLCIFIALIAVTLIACEQQPPPLPFPDIQYEMRTMEQETGNEDDSSSAYAVIKIAYPEVTKAGRDTVKGLLNQYIYCFINDQFNDSLCQYTIEGHMGSFIDEYEKFKSFVPDSKQRWEDRKTIAVLTDTLGIFSIGLSSYSYTGGAHSNSAKYFANFNAFNGDYIRLGDVLTEGFLDPLTDIAEKVFRDMKKLKPQDSLDTSGYVFEDNQFALNENYLLTDRSLVFFYNNYEIAPYASGTTKLVIPYQLITHLVNQEHILGIYLKELKLL